MNDTEKRRAFQKVKTFSTERFWDWMNYIHTRAYAAAVRHYTEAAEITLTPKQRQVLHAKAEEIRENWDGMKTVTIEDTEAVEYDSVWREKN